jgi:hypothetical protein
MLWLWLACTTSKIDSEDSPVDSAKDANCASTFGDALTDAFGRVDGTVVAIVEPGNSRCAKPNSDHVIVQVELDGAVYRMVVNVLSSGEDSRIQLLQTEAPLPAPAFSEGWHTGLSLDYPTDLGISSTDSGWESLEMEAAAARISDSIVIGAPIAVYASSSGGSYADSTHLIHRNGDGRDGALVLSPTATSSTWLLFRFADQDF